MGEPGRKGYSDSSGDKMDIGEHGAYPACYYCHASKRREEESCYYSTSGSSIEILDSGYSGFIYLLLTVNGKKQVYD